MKYLSLAFIFILFLNGCAAQNFGGLGKPTVFSSPVDYMNTVGLDIYYKKDVLNVLGNPAGVISIDGLDYWSYYLRQGYGERTYTYIFRGTRLVNVRYNDNGPYDGITAIKSQN